MKKRNVSDIYQRLDIFSDSIADCVIDISDLTKDTQDRFEQINKRLDTIIEIKQLEETIKKEFTALFHRMNAMDTERKDELDLIHRELDNIGYALRELEK